MLLRRILLLFFALLILTADAGVSVFKSKCTISGKQNWSFTGPKKCCRLDADYALEAEPVLRKASCCELESKWMKSGFQAENLRPNLSFNSTLKEAAAWLETFTVPVSSNFHARIFSAEYSPPSALFRCSLMGVFRL